MKRLNVVEPRHSLADILNRAEYQGERIMIHCQGRLVVLVVDVGNRRDIYRPS